MSATDFDTLAYAKKLREAGFTESQAETQAEALRAVIDSNLATKADIALVHRDIELLRRDMKELESALRRDMKELENTLRQAIKESELRGSQNLAEAKADLLKWMVGLLIAQGGLIVALIELL